MDSLFSLERFDRPWCLWFALLIVLIWWMSRRSLSGLGPVRGAASVGMRAIVVILLVLVMAGAHRILKNNDLTVLFLLDGSRSIPSDMRKKAEQFIQAVSEEIKDNDRVAVLTFDGQTNIEQLPTRGGILAPFPLADGSRPDRTNIAQGLRMSAACTSDSTANRVIIFSDGNQNIGDAVEEARAARANGISVDVVLLEYAQGADVVFEKLRAPSYANLHEQVPLRLILSSGARTSGTINVYQQTGQEEKLIDLDPESKGSGQRVTLEPGRNAFTVKLPIQTARAHQFRAEFVPDNQAYDRTTQNNVARAFTNVEGPAKVLYVGTAGDQVDDEMLVEALRTESIEVDYRPAESITLEPAVLQDYAAVILSNTPANLFSAQQQRALVNYVRDMGGGLIMTGGDEGFGAGGWQGSPVEDIMPVRFDVDAVRQIPRGALAIVMHSCEMPQGNAWGVKTAVAALKTISSLDYFGVVGWGINNYHWEVKMQVAANKDAIARKLNTMQNADMPAFETPMRMAVQALMNCKDAATRHMIIISDGDPAPPSGGLINKMVGNKITCSTVMVFPHYGGFQTMRNIAKRTGGTFYLLQKAGDEKKLPRIFTKEAKIVRRPLIRDEIFTPKLRPSNSEILAGIDEGFPELKGYVVTTPRQDAHMEMPLVTEKGDPLLAHWLCGFGRTVAFTSGRWKHWGSNWPSWPSYSKLWAQAVRWCMRQGSAADFDVSTSVEGDRVHVVIENIREDQGFENFRRFDGRVVRPDGESVGVPIRQTGPGRYEADFSAKEMGTYLINIRAAGTADEKAVSIRTGVTVAFSPEYKDLTANEALLRRVAIEADGAVLSVDDPDAERVFARLAPTVSRKPVWESLLRLAIFFFLLDVAVRRIAFDPVKMLAMARSHIASLAGRFGSGRRAEATLTGLKGVRERVRTEKTGEGDTATIASMRQALSDADRDAGPALDASAKFDAGGTGKPTGDLTQVMGGAAETPAGPKPPKPADAKDEEPQESTTARLLKARKRAQDKQQDGDS